MLKNKFFVIVLTAFLAVTLGYYIGRTTGKEKGKEILIAEKQHELKEIRETGYKFISPLLECQDAAPSTRNNMLVLENKLKNYIREIMSEKKADHISVYVRELNNGPWIGIAENEPYSPASLLKVPILIAALMSVVFRSGIFSSAIFLAWFCVNLPTVCLPAV